jgi:phage baseplate assembly protein W
MTTPSKFQLSLRNASVIDVNPNYTIDNLPDRLADDLAVLNCQIHNLLNCAPGQRGRIFDPQFGSLWLHFIQEPINDVTAKKMKIFMVQSLEKYVPSISIDYGNTQIVADLTIPGYLVRLAFSSPYAGRIQTATFNMSV